MEKVGGGGGLKNEGKEWILWISGYTLCNLGLGIVVHDTCTYCIRGKYDNAPKYGYIFKSDGGKVLKFKYFKF